MGRGPCVYVYWVMVAQRGPVLIVHLPIRGYRVSRRRGAEGDGLYKTMYYIMYHSSCIVVCVCVRLCTVVVLSVVSTHCFDLAL